MKTILAVLAGLLGTGFLAYLCAYSQRDLIQQDLSGRAKRALANDTFSDLLVSADGRELTLQGTAPSQQAKFEAGETVGKLYGVHTVTNLLEVREARVSPVPSQEPVALPPSVPPLDIPKATRTITPPPPPTKVKPATPKVPERREALASLSRPPETPASPTRCQDAIAAALGRRQIYFESNKAVIRPVSYPVLDRLAEAAKSCPAKSIEISGHTDQRGSRQKNIRLSRNRAQAVIDYLIKKGVPAQRLTIVGYGPTKPVASNATATGMQRNRRVEFTLKGLDKGSEKKELQR
jgi:outer membrane protein OmpA-like peptidoglycan-associated protein